MYLKYQTKKYWKTVFKTANSSLDRANSSSDPCQTFDDDWPGGEWLFHVTKRDICQVPNFIGQKVTF